MPIFMPLVPPGRHTQSISVPVSDIGSSVGLVVVVNVVSLPKGGRLYVTISGEDVVYGTTWTVLEANPIEKTGTTALRIRPGITPGPNAAADLVTPNMRVEFEHSGTKYVDYSATAHLTN